MKINNIVEGTTVNGPGLRLGIWVQGCKRNCPGCFNADACKTTGGYEMSVDDILKLLDKNKYDGISVSGGEPFYQSEQLEELLKKTKSKGYTTLVFTGYLFDELKNYKALKYCDYLIDGPYIKEIKSRCKFTGSGNQRVLKLKDGLIEEDITDLIENIDQSEIIINPDGTLITTGFLDI